MGTYRSDNPFAPSRSRYRADNPFAQPDEESAALDFLPGVTRAGYRGVVNSLADTMRGLGQVGESSILPEHAGLAGLLRRGGEALRSGTQRLLGESDSTPERLVEGAGYLAGTAAQYAGTAGAARAAGLVPRATSLLGRFGQGAALSAPLDIAQGANEETSTARALADLGVPGMERAASTMPGRIATELGIGNLVGGALDAGLHLRGLRSARASEAAQAAAEEARRASRLERARDLAVKRMIAREGEQTATRRQLLGGLDELLGRRQTQAALEGEVGTPNMQAARAFEEELAGGRRLAAGAREREAARQAAEASRNATRQAAHSFDEQMLGAQRRRALDIPPRAVAPPVVEPPTRVMETVSAAPKVRQPAPSVVLTRPEGVSKNFWRVARKMSDDDVVAEFARRKQAFDLALQRAEKEQLPHRKLGIRGSRYERIVAETHRKMMEQLDLIAKQRGIELRKPPEPTAMGADTFLTQTHPENPIGVEPRDIGYEAVGGRDNHDAMIGIRDALINGHARGLSIEDAYAQLPPLSKALVDAKPGVWEEWYNLYGKARKAGQPAGFAAESVMRGLAGAGVGGVAGSAAGAQMAPEGQRTQYAVMGGLLGAGVGAGIGTRLGREAMPTAAELGRTRQMVRFDTQTARVTDRQVKAVTPTGPVPPLPMEDLDRFLTHGNLDKFGLGPESMERARRTIETAYGAMVQQGRDFKVPQPLAQVDEIAATLAEDPKRVAEMLRRNPTRLTGPEALALRYVYRDNDRFIEEGAKRLEQARQGQALLSDEARATLQQDVAKRLEEQRVIIGHFIEFRSGSGRDLGSLRAIAKRTLDGMTWQGIARQMKGLDLTTAERAGLDQVLKSGDREAVLNYVARLRKSTPTEKLTSAIKASWLFRLTTQARNLLSTAVNIGMHRLADGPAILLDMAAAGRYGSRTKAFVGGRGVFAAGRARGWADAKRVWRSGLAPEFLEKMDIPRRTNYDTKVIDTLVNKTFNILGAEDALLRGYPTQRAIAELAWTDGWNAGFRGKDLESFVEAELRAPSPQTEALAKVAGARETFQYDTRLASALNSFKARMRGHPLAETITELVFPFVRTPVAVADTAIRFSPLGFISSGTSLAKAERLYKAVMTPQEMTEFLKLRKQFAERGGQALIGTAMPMLAGYYWFTQGRMTGSQPIFPSEREQWRAEGKQPFSLLFNGRWYRMPLVAPLGSLLATGAGIAEVQRNQGMRDGRKAQQAAAGALNVFLDQPALTGTKNVIQAVTDIGGAGSRYAEGQLASMVPGAIAQTAQAADPYVRQPRNAIEALETRFPGAAEYFNVPTRINPMGQEVRRDENPVTRTVRALLDPFASTPDRTQADPLLREMERVGASVGPLKKEPTESDAQYRNRQLIIGQRTRMALERAVRMSAYRRLAPSLQKDFLEDAALMARRGDHFNGPATARRLVRRERERLRGGG